MNPTKLFKAIGILIITLVILAILAVGGYALYLETHYYRIADNQQETIAGNQSSILQAGKTYRASTYNVGFGAYTPDYTFFMDEGIMADGKKTIGSESRAESKQSVINCTNGDISLIKSLNVDFALFQEVDENSTRSFYVNQRQAFEQAFENYGSIFSKNFHAPFLMYPPTNPHGSVQSGILTLSKYAVTNAERRSYPIDESFPTKYFDLDRCFDIMRIPVNNGRELVLINSHMSAYDKGGLVRKEQLALLRNCLAEECSKGNYVVCGGDWNHALGGSEKLYPSKQLVPPWVSVLNDSDLPAGFRYVKANNFAEVPTCRGVDIPYEKGVTYTCTIDGFFVSDNVAAEATHIDNEFRYSDHNPVMLTFSLQK